MYVSFLLMCFSMLIFVSGAMDTLRLWNTPGRRKRVKALDVISTLIWFAFACYTTHWFFQETIKP